MNANETMTPGDVPERPPEQAGAEPVPALSVDAAATEPTQAPLAEAHQGRPEGVGKGSARPLPETLTAARDAAAFVAQLFTEASAPEQAAATAPAAEVPPPDGEPTQGGAGDGASPAVEPSSVEAEVSPLHGQHVLVLGLGASGLAMARWCVRQGARVTVADTREAPPQLARLQSELLQVSFRAGAFEPELIAGTDIRAVFKSPGLSPASVALVVDAAQAQGLPCGNELSLFAQALAELKATRAYAPQVLAITGTNGKTTTTALTSRLVAHAGKTVAMAGNIGPSLLDTLARHLDAGTLPEVWVLELSSFQLDGVYGFEPTAATVLNLTQDHLDWHGSMEAYGAAKARIFGTRGLLVLNRDDLAVMAMLIPAGASQTAKAQSTRAKLQKKPQPREYLSFGAGMPQRPGDFGIETIHGMAWLVHAAGADETIKKKRAPALLSAGGAVQYKDEDIALHVQRLMPVDALRIRGRHNATNALAALALANAAGCRMAAMLHALRDYAGEPHRVASVAVVQGVEYFDDSKGTNVGATVAALTGLGAERKLVLIAGGDGKGQDFSPLAGPVRQHARAVVLMGRDAPALRAALESTGVALLDAASMQAAVELAAWQAQTGDAVLMSPACASFDMFENYGHRARVFCEAVQSLAHDAGVLS